MAIITIKDIAADTGLSVSTVSVVLSGKAEARGITLPTQERVRASAKKLGYQFNGYARALRTGKTFEIGVFGANLDLPVPRTILRHVSRTALAHGYHLSLFDASWSEADDQRVIRDLERRRVDGLLFVSAQRIQTPEFRSALERFSDIGVPIVTVDDWGAPKADVVTVDREHGCYLATAHLLQQGHRNVAITLAPTAEHPLLSARMRGYQRALDEFGCEFRDDLCFTPGLGNPNCSDGYELAQAILKHPASPTAMVCVNDRMAIGALRAVFEAGKRTPQDLAIIGFDGLPELEYAAVPLSTVAQPVQEVAEACITYMLERIEGSASPLPPRLRVLKPELIVRASTDFKRTTS